MYWSMAKLQAQQILLSHVQLDDRWSAIFSFFILEEISKLIQTGLAVSSWIMANTWVSKQH